MGFIIPGGTGPEQLELAIAAERAGWDGVFVWEGPYGVDPWGLLAAVAQQTEHVKLGTVLTPLPWRRPWKVASQVATLDQLSAGRAIVTVGLGAVAPDLALTGEELDLKSRAAMLDEGIDLVRALWDGATSFVGDRYRYESERDDLSQVGRPVQDRIPIWVVGLWPRPRSMRRVLRCDGIVPQYDVGDREGTPDDIREIRTWLIDHGARSDLDIIAEGETPPDDKAAASDLPLPWAEAGCTWWLETRWEMPHIGTERREQVRERILAGPPQLLP